MTVPGPDFNFNPDPGLIPDPAPAPSPAPAPAPEPAPEPMDPTPMQAGEAMQVGTPPSVVPRRRPPPIVREAVEPVPAEPVRFEGGRQLIQVDVQQPGAFAASGGQLPALRTFRTITSNPATAIRFAVTVPTGRGGSPFAPAEGPDLGSFRTFNFSLPALLFAPELALNIATESVADTVGEAARVTSSALGARPPRPQQQAGIFGGILGLLSGASTADAAARTQQRVSAAEARFQARIAERLAAARARLRRRRELASRARITRLFASGPRRRVL